jgi:hypothetical protein
MKKEIQAKLKRQKVLITCLSLGGALLTGAAATMTTLYCLNNFSSSKFEEVVQYDFATDETSRFSFTIPIEMRRYEHLYISCEKFNNDGTNFVICYYDQKAGTTGPFRTIVGTTFD